MQIPASLAVAAISALIISGAATATAQAATGDADRDGIPTRWEKSHGMNPWRAADALADFDRDGLKNLGEYRQGGLLRDEDTDNDGADDGDEVKDGLRSTDIDDPDTDDDGILDGDEDADHDDVDNEDEDDALEGCRADDDDRDGDRIADEDENELHSTVGDADTDDDGIVDGDEDADEDGEANEDEDDSVGDNCSGDHDGDGQSDEDEGDEFGTIDAFDAESGTLVVIAENGYTVTAVVTEETEIEFEDADDVEATTDDLQPGVVVAELEFDDETGALEEIEIFHV